MSYKKHKSSHNLEREIEKVVDRELRENIPLKARFVSADAAAVVSDGLLFDLSAIMAQEDASDLWNTRTSDQVHAKTLRVRAHLQGQAPSVPTTDWRDGTSLVRVIILSWLPYTLNTTLSASMPGAVLDLRDPGTAGFEYLAPHVSQGLEGQFKIHSDETITLSPRAGAQWTSSTPVTFVQVCLFRNSPYQFHP